MCLQHCNNTVTSSVFIHPFSTPRSGRGGAGDYPSSHRAKGGVHPGQVASPSQGHTETHETNNHAHSLLGTILESPINLTCMFLDGGRKPEYPERTHAYTGRTCKLHTERNSQDSKQEPSCFEVTVLTTVQPHLYSIELNSVLFIYR